jgi:BolA family transcriptional regulator, general stress-responsive regulator
MRMQQTIERKLARALAPSHLEVLDESHQHSVPKGSETHFKVVVASAAFAGKRSVARHQLVYGLLAEELAGGVHALALHTYTPQEWSERAARAPASPACMGGSKQGR